MIFQMTHISKYIIEIVLQHSSMTHRIRTCKLPEENVSSLAFLSLTRIMVQWQVFLHTS